MESKQHQRKKFTDVEDRILRDYVSAYGLGNWGMIAKSLPGRTPRQCRERWKNYLHPSIRNTEWTMEEDTLLETLFQKYGRKWVLISQHFNNRTDINVKNRWLVIQRHKPKGDLPEETNTKDAISELIDVMVEPIRIIEERQELESDWFNINSNNPFNYF